MNNVVHRDIRLYETISAAVVVVVVEVIEVIKVVVVVVAFM